MFGYNKSKKGEGEMDTLRYEEKGSLFLAYFLTLDSPEMGEDFLRKLKEENKKARHFLYARRYKNKFGARRTTSSEDREPVSSRKKIARLREKKDRRGCGVFIVRYFGGKKLGASHLDSVYFSLGTRLFPH